MSDQEMSLPGASSAAEDSDMEWDEVEIAPATNVQPERVASTPAPVLSGRTIEINLGPRNDKGKGKADPKAKVMSQAERLARLNSHKIHTVALLASAAVRNYWANNQLLQARLMSLTPMSIQTSFAMIHKKRQPDAAKRGRLFEAAMERLCAWWYESFDVYEDIGVKSRTYDQVEAGALADEEGEVLRSAKSMMKHALQQSGSRDVSAQLFTALCRALGIPARVVVSLQSVPWQASVGKAKTAGRKKKDVAPERDGENDEEDDDDMEEVAIAGSSKQPAPAPPPVTLRKRKPAGRKLVEVQPPPAGWPPVFWTEVFSRPDGRWIPVDPTRKLVNKKRMFEPPRNDPNNRMTYVVALEEDGYARDVTARYTRKPKLRGGRSQQQWWESVMAPLTRPYRLNRDDVEDEEMHALQVVEGMPTSVAGFKDHPIYVLERHLRRDEVVNPRIEIGKFRGEPVFSRANVLSLKTAENWMRQGRAIRAGEQALKRVPLRAVTINRRRELEAAAAEGTETLQGLYSFRQTELYTPPPVVRGKVPKNDFGNIDLYVPSMLPKGAVHVAHKGTAKIARQLGFDYAEAVVGFEFKKRRALPIINGVVVAAENEEALLEAYWASVADSEEKERAKRRERVLKKWTRLVHGLRIRDRLQREYASAPNGDRGNVETFDEHKAGGFVTELDHTIQHFSLPKPQHVVVENTMRPSPTAVASGSRVQSRDEREEVQLLATAEAAPMEDVEMVEAVEVDEQPERRRPLVPMTMQQFADGRADEAVPSQADGDKKLPTVRIRPGAARASARQSAASSPAPSSSSARPRRAAAKARAAPATRGKKRARRASSDSGASSSLSEPDDGGSEAEFVPSTPVKTVGGRTLRARIPKSAEKAKAEKELERAFRAAIAD